MPLPLVGLARRVLTLLTCVRAAACSARPRGVALRALYLARCAALGYVGATAGCLCLDRHRRQHNQGLAGGALAVIRTAGRAAQAAGMNLCVVNVCINAAALAASWRFWCSTDIAVLRRALPAGPRSAPQSVRLVRRWGVFE